MTSNLSTFNKACSYLLLTVFLYFPGSSEAIKITILFSQQHITFISSDSTPARLYHQELLVPDDSDLGMPFKIASLEVSELPNILFNNHPEEVQFISPPDELVWHIPEVGTRLAQLLSRGWKGIFSHHENQPPVQLRLRALSYYLATGLISGTYRFRVLSTDMRRHLSIMKPGHLVCVGNPNSEHTSIHLNILMIYLGESYFLVQVGGHPHFLVVTKANLDDFIGQFLPTGYQYNLVLFLEPEDCCQEDAATKNKLLHLDYFYKKKPALLKMFATDPMVSGYFNHPDALLPPTGSYIQ